MGDPKDPSTLRYGTSALIIHILSVAVLNFALLANWRPLTFGTYHDGAVVELIAFSAFFVFWCWSIVLASRVIFNVSRFTAKHDAGHEIFFAYLVAAMGILEVSWFLIPMFS